MFCINSALCFLNSALSQLSSPPTQPFLNSALSEKNQDSINSVSEDFFQSLPPNGAFPRPPHPEACEAPLALFQKGWVGHGWTWAELREHRAELGKRRAELVEG
jgi:hypothetical protein